MVTLTCDLAVRDASGVIRDLRAEHNNVLPACGETAIAESHGLVGGWWLCQTMRQTGWNQGNARRKVKNAIEHYGWNPAEKPDYDDLHQRIMTGELLNNNLYWPTLR